MLGAVGRPDRGEVDVVDGGQDGSASGRETIDVAVAAAAEAAADGLGVDDQPPSMRERETAPAGAKADLAEDHLAQMFRIHVAVGAGDGGPGGGPR